MTLAVYQQSGIGGINGQLKNMGDGQAVVVPVRVGCPSMTSLPNPVGSGHTSGQVSVDVKNGAVTVRAKGIPAGDVLVVASESGANGSNLGSARLTRAPAPSCVSLPAAMGGSGDVTTQSGHSGGQTTTQSDGSPHSGGPVTQSGS